jgi:hypothetical protein
MVSASGTVYVAVTWNGNDFTQGSDFNEAWLYAFDDNGAPGPAFAPVGPPRLA